MHIQAKVFLRDMETELYKVVTVSNVGVKGLTLPLEALQEDYEILQVTFEVSAENDFEKELSDEKDC